MAADDDLRISRTKFNRVYSEAELALLREPGPQRRREIAFPTAAEFLGKPAPYPDRALDQRLDYSQVVAYPVGIIRFLAADPAAGRLLLRTLLGPASVVMEAWPPSEEPETTEFEEWLLGRWLRDIRSDEFRGSVQYERLMAEWERGAHG